MCTELSYNPPIVCPGVNNCPIFHLPAFLPTNVYRFLTRSLSWLLFRTTGYSFLGLLLIALLDWIPCFLDPVFLFLVLHLLPKQKVCRRYNMWSIGCLKVSLICYPSTDHLAGNRLLDWKWFSCKILKVLRRMKGDLVCASSLPMQSYRNVWQSSLLCWYPSCGPHHILLGVFEYLFHFLS